MELTAGYWKVESEDGELQHVFYSDVDFGYTPLPGTIVVSLPSEEVLSLPDRFLGMLRDNGHDPTPNPSEDIINAAIELRDSLLRDSDFTQLLDVPEESFSGTRAEWAVYRQELRDVTDLEGFPNIHWPTEPL